MGKELSAGCASEKSGSVPDAGLPVIEIPTSTQQPLGLDSVIEASNSTVRFMFDIIVYLLQLIFTYIIRIQSRPIMADICSFRVDIQILRQDNLRLPPMPTITPCLIALQRSMRPNLFGSLVSLQAQASSNVVEYVDVVVDTSESTLARSLSEDRDISE